MGRLFTAISTWKIVNLSRNVYNQSLSVLKLFEFLMFTRFFFSIEHVMYNRIYIFIKWVFLLKPTIYVEIYPVVPVVLT